MYLRFVICYLRFLIITFHFAKFCHSRTTRFSLKNHLTIPLFKSKQTQRSIKYIEPKIWNSISHKLRTMSFNKFNKHYKSVLLFSD